MEIIIIINVRSLFSTAVVKHHDQRNFGRKRFIWLTGYSLSSWEVNVGTQGRNTDAGTETEVMEEYSSLACCLCLSQFAFYKTQNHLSKMAPPIVSWTLLWQMLIKKIFHRLAYRAIWLRHFLSWGLLFPHDPHLCWVDKKRPNQGM